MSGKARRVPLAHLHNGVPASEDASGFPQVKLKGPKGRLALLKDENARFCAPKTRIPTPAPKKKPAVAAPDRSIFVSKIPSPKSSLPSLEGPKDSQVTKADVSSQQQQQHGASPQAQAPAFQFDMEAATPEDPVQGHCGLDEIASDALQLSEEIADHLAATPVAHPEMHMEGDELQALAISQEACVDCSTQTEPSSSPQVAGMGTPLDFTSVFNLDDFDSSTLLLGPQADSGSGAEHTPVVEKALRAWLAANTPSQPGRGAAYTGQRTPGQLLSTPAMQGLLQQLRISTPALGAQGVASTPFLAGLARTLPQLTPGMSPYDMVAFLRGAQGSPLSDSPPAAAAPAHQAGSEGKSLASPGEAQATGTRSDAWVELADLTPGPRGSSDVSMWVSPAGGSPGSRRAAAMGSPSFADGCPAISDTANCDRPGAAAAEEASAAHKKRVSWGSGTEHSITPAAAAADEAAAAQPDMESVGSASPFEAANAGARSLARCASDTGASVVRGKAEPQQPTTAAASTPQAPMMEQVRVVTPVNPAPAAAKASGIGRGCAGLPRAAETCEVIHPPPVPTTPVHILANPDDELAKGTIAPANTPADPEYAAPAALLTTYQLMLAHIVGGAYVSPAVGRSDSPGPPCLGSPASPHGQRDRSYTPCLLATPAGTGQRSRSRLGPGAAAAAMRTPATLLRRPPRTPGTLRGFLATPPQLRGSFGSAARGTTPGTALSVDRGSLTSWLARTGLADVVGSPARASLEALWARAGQAGSLRLEVETVRVAEQERALAEARQHLQQWDCLMQHNASLEAENAELRAELAQVAAARAAAEAALERASAERAAAADAAAGQRELAAAEAERCKTTGLRLLELADHAALVAAAYEDEKQALLEELALSRQRLAAAQEAATTAHNTPTTSQRQRAALEAQLQSARQEHWEAAAACEAAQEAAAAAAEEKARLLTELQDAREALRAATDGAAGCHDIEAAELAAQLKEAHEALYELEMDALEAQRIMQETQDIMAVEDDTAEPIVADEADIKEMQQVIEAASDVNKVYEEENEKLRAELAAAQDELAAVKQQQLSLSQQPAEGIASSTESVAEGLSAREQERVKEDDSTPTKQPTVAAAIVSAAAAAHAAPVTFYGSHRVFLAPHPADMPAAAGMAVVARQATPQSASPVAAWCTVTDRLRRLRADLEDTSNTMHLLRSAGKAPQQLPARELPAIGSANSQELSAALPEAVAQQAPRGLAQKEAEVPSPSPAMQAEREAEAAAAPAAEGARQREETPEAAAERIQLVLRIGHLTPPQEPVEAATPEPKRNPPAADAAEDSSPDIALPRFGLWGRRGGARKKASASEEREFRRRAAALKIRISPYFNRRREAAAAE